MADTPNGDGYTYNWERRMDRMEAAHLAVMEELRTMRDMWREQHIQYMEEIRELINLQKEHRIDIMALFEVNKQTRQRLEKLEGGNQ
jgi:hypothetical protein